MKLDSIVSLQACYINVQVLSDENKSLWFLVFFFLFLKKKKTHVKPVTWRLPGARGR